MLSVDRPSTECRPITDRYIGQVSANYRPTIGEVSVNEKLYRPRHIWNDYRPCLDRVSTDYRPTIDRYIDRLSTERRPSIDRLSTDYRPSVERYIDRYFLNCVPKITYLCSKLCNNETHTSKYTIMNFYCIGGIGRQWYNTTS